MAIREVIFRGKRTDCEAWVEGDLLHYESGEMAICKGFSKYGYEATEIIGRYKVIPETVGQYTGLTDKNGVRIFEGDIVRATIERAERCQSPRIENGVIGYDCIGMIGLILYKDKNGENVWSDFFNELSLSGLIEDYYFEIIGNIHDNPELLQKI